MTQKEVLKFLANSRIYVNGKGKEILKKLVELGCKSGEVNTDLPLLAIDCNNTIHNVNPMWKFIYLYKEIDADEILSLVVTEPAYRPFKDAEECWQEMLKHEPFGWITDYNKHHLISSVNNIFVWLSDKVYYSFEGAFNTYKFVDETPFGIKEE